MLRIAKNCNDTILVTAFIMYTLAAEIVVHVIGRFREAN
jgi:hypothetical protein